MKIRMTLSIGFAGAQHTEEIDIDDAPPELSGDDLVEWLTDNYWVEWTNNFIDGGVEVLDGEGE
jgi:hypothetical protein